MPERRVEFSGMIEDPTLGQKIINRDTLMRTRMAYKELLTLTDG